MKKAILFLITLIVASCMMAAIFPQPCVPGWLETVIGIIVGAGLYTIFFSPKSKA